MAIGSVNYPQAVIVNGYPCKNCTDVDLAKAHIDPQHPSAGPYGVNAKADPSLAGKHADKNGVVTFGGSLSDSNADRASSAAMLSSPLGSQLDLSV
jgi:hypothetical protein